MAFTPEQKREWKAGLKAQGLCVNGCGEKAIEGKTLCIRCHEILRRARADYDARIRLSPAAITERARKYAERAARRQARLAEKQARRIEREKEKQQRLSRPSPKEMRILLGECIHCPSLARPGARRCQQCREKANAGRRRQRAENPEVVRAQERAGYERNREKKLGMVHEHRKRIAEIEFLQTQSLLQEKMR